MLIQTLRASALVADPMQLEMLLPRADFAPSLTYWLTGMSGTSSEVTPSDVASVSYESTIDLGTGILNTYSAAPLLRLRHKSSLHQHRRQLQPGIRSPYQQDVR